MWTAVEAPPLVSSVATGLADECINQTGRLQPVERLDRFTKTVLGEVLDCAFVQLVLLDHFQDEVSLLFRATPGLIPAVAVPLGCIVSWQEAGLLERGINGLLQQRI